MNKILAFVLVLILAILAIFIYRGRDSQADVVSGSIQNSQNLFTPDPDDDGSSVAGSAKDLPTVAPRGSVNNLRVRVRPTTTTATTTTVMSEPYGDEAEIHSQLSEREGTKSVRKTWKANRVSAATRLKSDKSGGFFMDDDELPPAVAQWERNKGKGKPGELKFLGRSPNVPETSVPAATRSQLKFLGRSEN